MCINNRLKTFINGCLKTKLYVFCNLHTCIFLFHSKPEKSLTTRFSLKIIDGVQGRSQHIATYRIAIGFALRYIAKGLRYITNYVVDFLLKPPTWTFLQELKIKNFLR